MALREFRLDSGPVDYLLLVDRKAVGVIEAKKEGTTLTEVELQAARYGRGLQGVPAPVNPLPFQYVSTGVETRFTNLLDPEPRSRGVFHFHRPEILAEWLDAQPIWLPAGHRLVNKPASLRLRLQNLPERGSDECSLPAPLGLLEYLVQNVDPALAGRSTDPVDVRAKRLALANKDPAIVDLALKNLRAGKRGRYWFVLEGPSRPDALLEATDFVVCVEGKRTEAGCTTQTSWMPRRSQLVRHMDAATDHFKGKSVFGLLIVEGSGVDPTQPSQHWHSECAAQYAPEMLADSLPHRTEEERAAIGRNVLGVTTWQSVCNATGIDYAALPDTA